MDITGFFLKTLLITIMVAQEMLFTNNILINQIVLWVTDGILIVLLVYFIIKSINNIQFYIIYIYSIVAKISIIFFFSLPRFILNKSDEPFKSLVHYEKNPPILSDSSEKKYAVNIITYYNEDSLKIAIVTVSILLTILVYLIICYLIHSNILHRKAFCLEHILFFIIIIHVSIDFLDISEFFFSSYFMFLLYFFRFPNESKLLQALILVQTEETNEDDYFTANEKNSSKFFSLTTVLGDVIFIVYGILIPLNISLHAYSLPTHSYERREKTEEGDGEDKGEGVYDKKYSSFYNKQASTGYASFLKTERVQIGSHEEYVFSNSKQTDNEIMQSTFSNRDDFKGEKHSSLGFDPTKKNSVNQLNNYENKHSTYSKDKFDHSTKIAGDVMSCLKYISIYSFFFTDICFGMARCFNLLFFSSNASSNFFMIKNFCFVIIHVSRLYRKSKFFQESKKKMQTKNRKARKNKSKSIDKLIQNKDSHRLSLISKYDKHMKKSFLNTKLLTFIGIPNEEIDLQQLKEQHFRITSFNQEKIDFYFFILYIKYKGSINLRKNISNYVDSVDSYTFKCFIIFFFYFLLLGIKIALVSFIYITPMNEYYHKSMEDLTYFQNVAILYDNIFFRIMAFLIIAYTVSVFFVYLFLCSLFDSIFMSIYYFFDLSSYIFVLLILSQLPLTQDLFRHFEHERSTALLIIVFTYQVYVFLSDSYIFIYMLLGRKMIAYKQDIRHYQKKKQEVEREIEEPPVVISVISLLIVKLLKFMKGPIVLNEIIIGNNFIKNARLDMFLDFSNIKEIILKIVLYIFCFMILIHDQSKNICFFCFFFAIQLLLSIIYMVLSKIRRFVAMDYVFTQSIFKEAYYDELEGINYFFGHQNKYNKYQTDSAILFNNGDIL